jgi:hypothetical protein
MMTVKTQIRGDLAMKDIDEAIIALNNKILILKEQIKDLLKAKRILDNVGKNGQLELTPIADKPTTVVGMAEQILRGTGHDLHVDKIIDGILKQYGVKVKKNSLAASLARYAMERRIFKKTPGQKNTFGLLEWDKEEKTKVA